MSVNNFTIKIMGLLEEYSPTISKARCRIFYKGLNRNGTYITEEFAEKLTNTLPYTPVKGIYTEDFGDHGKQNADGRIYGIVPEKSNASWEKHLDEDNVEREYLCCDVLLYTALYTEANEIVGKGLSMELYRNKSVGQWEMREGVECFVFTDGCFLGLQVLGDEVTPCFEGAEFYALNLSKDLICLLKELEGLKYTKKEVETKMSFLNYKLSDSEKFDQIWIAMNPNYTEEQNYQVDYSICAVYDDYCICSHLIDNTFVRAYYTKENDVVTITSTEPIFIVDVTEEEYTILEKIKGLNGNTYAKADEIFGSVTELNNTVENLTKEKEAFELKISESESLNSTLITEKADLEKIVSDKDQTLHSLQEEIDSLKEYKMEIEETQKKEVLTKYTSKLSAETINEFNEKLNEYTVEQLDRELAYAFVSTTPSVLQGQDEPNGKIPKKVVKTGIAAILEKY